MRLLKRIKPFVDVAYQYEKGQKLTSLQQASNSEKDGCMVQVS